MFLQLTDTMQIELLGEVPVYISLGIQSLSALILGGLIGFDRELKIKPAGVKTNMMICFGAMIFTVIGIFSSSGDAGADPNRISAQIVSGIGFLGAGAIVRVRGMSNISGLTTAATIWVVASIGYTIGTGRPFTATLFALSVLVILNLVNPIMDLLYRKNKRVFHVEILCFEDIKKVIFDFLILQGIQPLSFSLEDFNRAKDMTTRKLLILNMSCSEKKMILVQKELLKIMKVERVSYYEVEGAENHMTVSSYD